MKEKLIAARELLMKGWCQGCLARDERGSPIDYFDTKAVSFCLLGALTKADVEPSERQKLRSLLPHGQTLTRFNETSTKEQVLEFIDRCIRGQP